jgi:hypothetical protein
VGAIAKGLVAGAAAAAEDEIVTRELEPVAVGVREEHRTLDQVRAVETDLDASLSQGDISFQITHEIFSSDDNKRRGRNLRG